VEDLTALSLSRRTSEGEEAVDLICLFSSVAMPSPVTEEFTLAQISSVVGDSRIANPFSHAMYEVHDFGWQILIRKLHGAVLDGAFR